MLKVVGVRVLNVLECGGGDGPSHNCIVQVDWLNSSHLSYSALHSKCLYVDHLPPNYRDLNNFRKIFSVVKNPPYCQVCFVNVYSIYTFIVYCILTICRHGKIMPYIG